MDAMERGQRPSVMGRKNYLFSKNDRGAEDNAIFYSLLENCDIVGVKPLQWLIHAIDPTFTLYSMFFLLYKRLRLTQVVPVYYRFSL